MVHGQIQLLFGVQVLTLTDDSFDDFSAIPIADAHGLGRVGQGGCCRSPALGSG